MVNLQSVVDEIVARCGTRGEAATPTLAAFVVRAIIMGNPSTFQMDKDLTADEVENLVTLCVNKICSNNDPAIDTIKLQVRRRVRGGMSAVLRGASHERDTGGARVCVRACGRRAWLVYGPDA